MSLFQAFETNNFEQAKSLLLKRLCNKTDKTRTSSAIAAFSRIVGMDKAKCLPLNDYLGVSYDTSKEMVMKHNLFEYCIIATHKKIWTVEQSTEILKLLFRVIKTYSWTNSNDLPFQNIYAIATDTSTLWAAQIYHEECIDSEVLMANLKKALNPNMDENQYTPLMALCRLKIDKRNITQLIDAADVFLKSGADPLLSTNYGPSTYSLSINAFSRGTTLTIACGHLNFSMVQKLIEYMPKLDLSEMRYPHYYSKGNPKNLHKEPYLLILIRVVIIGYYCIQHGTPQDKANEGKLIVEYLLKKAKQQNPPYYLDIYNYDYRGANYETDGFEEAMAYAKKDFSDLDTFVGNNRVTNSKWAIGEQAQILFSHQKFEEILNTYKSEVESEKLTLNESHWTDVPGQQPRSSYPRGGKGKKSKNIKNHLCNKIKKSITRKQKKMRTRRKL